jgi:hypothetical protein
MPETMGDEILISSRAFHQIQVINFMREYLGGFTIFFFFTC